MLPPAPKLPKDPVALAAPKPAKALVVAAAEASAPTAAAELAKEKSGAAVAAAAKVAAADELNEKPAAAAADAKVAPRATSPVLPAGAVAGA
jgi:hypothetical protein